MVEVLILMYIHVFVLLFMQNVNMSFILGISIYTDIAAYHIHHTGQAVHFIH